MLQNRVDPFGNIIKVSARGLFMGNRGLLHNDRKEIVRSYKLNAWITCKLEFKNWKRTPMTPGQYTELFFMDEATSFAAGHRPCFECRREDAVRFKTAWVNGNPGYGFDIKTPIRELDKVMHRERIDEHGGKVIFDENPASLPDGTIVLFDEDPYLIAKGMLHLWTPSGYTKHIPIKPMASIGVLTPQSVVNALRAGYKPQVSLKD